MKRVKLEKNEVTRRFDFERLRFITKVVVRNLNKVIDRNFYPLPEAKNSNMRHRPIGIGIQGLADCFMLMRYPYESDEAVLLNKQIFETNIMLRWKRRANLPKKMVFTLRMKDPLSAKESFSLTCGV